MNLKQLWSIIRGRRTNFSWMNASWTYYPDGDPLGKILIAKTGGSQKRECPTPWKFVQNSWQYTTIYDANGNHVCQLDLEDWGVTEENQDELEKAQEIVAHRIIDAVNR
jgi:hypothetical protein